MKQGENYTQKTMSKTIFFGTYAIMEIFKGNKDYKIYLDNNIVLTKLNLFELYYNLYREYGESTAKKELERYSSFVIDFDKQIITDAAKLKFIFKKQKMSMVDCIGYIIAKKLDIKFLTGDEQFKYLPNVEFVK